MSAVLEATHEEIGSASEGWPEQGLRWVEDPRKSAPGLDSLLIWAHRQGASRISFQTGHPVWIMVHGRNRKATSKALSEVEVSVVTNHLYGADGTARLQGGSDFDVSYAVAISRSERLRFRVNATPIHTSRRGGANLVLRPIPDMPPDLDAQLVEPEILENYRPRGGFVVVSGSTGSGKSTLIGGFTVAKLRDPNGHYNIVEGAAPIEFLLDRLEGPTSTIAQTEIPRDLPTFEAFIRGCWRREATDIIVGESRDGATMSASLNAAMAGSTVTTTIHADDLALTIQRMVALCPGDERDNLVTSIAQSLRLIINQRLVFSTDGKRTALREYLVFDAPLRRRLMQTSPSDWPDLIRTTLETNGQSYRKAITRALEEGRISPTVAEGEMRWIG